MKLFVLGVSRSGTTLLHQILSTHSELAGICETEILKRYRQNSEIDELLNHLPLTDEEGVVVRRFFKNYSSDATLTKWQVLDYYCQAHQVYFGVNGYVEKSPAHSYFVQEILAEIADSKIIFMLRDPRANIASKNYARHSRGEKIGLPKFLQFCLNLSEIININRYLESQLVESDRNRLMIIHYEEIVLNTETTMRSVLDFAGLPFERSYENIKPKDMRMSAWGSAGMKNSSFVESKVRHKDESGNVEFTSAYIQSNTIESQLLDHWRKRLSKSHEKIITKVITLLCPATAVYYDLKCEVSSLDKLFINVFSIFSKIEHKIFLFRNYRICK